MENGVWGLLRDLAKKEGVSEVIINRPDQVFVEHQGDLVKLNVKLSEQEVDAFAVEVAQKNAKKFEETHPILDGVLPDGSRINMIHKVHAQGHTAITIRRYLQEVKSFDSNKGHFGLDAQWVEFFKTLVTAKVNIMVAGGTGVGKTTFLNLLLNEIGSMERVITIEDTFELSVQLPNTVRLETRSASSTFGGALGMRDLVKNTLRMRPDRIIIGEVRGAEVFDLLQAMNTGHDGSMASVHANSAAECLGRLETLYLLSGYDMPVRAIRGQLGQAINFIIQLKRNRQGERVVAQVAELAGFEGDKILMQDIGLLKNGKLSFTGMVPKCMNRLVEAGLPKDFFVSGK